MQARTLNASSQQADTVLGALQVLVDAKAEYDAMDEDDIDQVFFFLMTLKPRVESYKSLRALTETWSMSSASFKI